MIFWIAAAILAFLATLCVILPLAKSKDKLPTNMQLDKALYRARIGEIEQDRILGRVSDEQADAAKSEEGRKLISVAKIEKTDEVQSTAVRSGKFYSSLQGICLILIPLISLSVYLLLGSPFIPDQSLASRISADPAGQTLEENVARVEGHLAKSPNDASGWAVLAPVYSRMKRYTDAANAWSRVLQLNPKYPEVRSLLAEAILNTTGGLVTKQARDLFLAELKINPASARSRYYVALALSQEGRFEDAAKSWQVLIDGANPQAPWLDTAKQYREEAMQRSGKVLTPNMSAQTETNGPTEEQIIEAQKLSETDRASMIQNMVEGLAAKLESDPSNQESWLRLIKAYNVLGNKQAAMSAISKATKAHANDVNFIASVNEISQIISNQDQQQ